MDDKPKITQKKKVIRKQIIADDKFLIQNKFILVQVGTQEKPADDDEIKEIRKDLELFINENKVNCLIYVTSHRVNMKVLN